MRWWTVGLLSAWVAISPAHSQDVLSDTELFAAYCLGRYNKSLEMAPGMLKALPP